MKKLLPILAIYFSLFTFSQEIKRNFIDGKIIVEGNDVDGITIYNTSTKLGTVSDINGNFSIAVAENDVLQVRALEYMKIDITITSYILESKKLNIYLIEEINTLDEVIVKRKTLSGKLKTDAKRAKKFNPVKNTIYFGLKDVKTFNLGDDTRSQLQRTTPHPTLVDGLNIINVVDQLLIPLFRSEVKDKKTAGIPDVPSESIKYYLGSNFLIENFKIPAYRVEEFIRYVEKDTFDFNLLNYGNELELLELLNDKSKEFLKK